MDNNRELKEIKDPQEPRIDQEDDQEGWTEDSEEGKSQEADSLCCGDPLIQERVESGLKD